MILKSARPVSNLLEVAVHIQPPVFLLEEHGQLDSVAEPHLEVLGGMLVD